MAGRPRTRAKKALEAALDSAQAMDDEREPDAYPEAPKERGGRGASAERMREITRLRMEMAKEDPAKKGGRPRTKFTRQEAEALAIDQMLPKALLVLRAQLDSPDERVAQAAAIKVLEHVKGKPTQKIEQKNEVSVIRYESAPWTFGQEVLGEVVAEEDHAALEAGSGA